MIIMIEKISKVWKKKEETEGEIKISNNTRGNKKNDQNQLGPPNFVESPPMPLPNMFPTFSTTFEVTLLIRFASSLLTVSTTVTFGFGRSTSSSLPFSERPLNNKGEQDFTTLSNRFRLL